MSLNFNSEGTLNPSTFSQDIQEYHPHLQNLWKHHIAIYAPYVPQPHHVRPLDDFTQSVCDWKRAHGGCGI